MELFASTGNWIEALGKTLIHSIWIGLLLLAMLRILLNSIPERYSDFRYRVSVISMLGQLVSVVLLFFLLYAPENRMLLAAETERISLLLAFLQKDLASLQHAADPRLLFVICTYIYLAGIPVVLIRSAIAIRYLRRMKVSGFPVQESWQIRFEQIKVSLGIPKKVALMETNKLTSPALIGFLKPVILVPAGMFSNLSVSQVETILLHELYHLRRFDTLVNVMQLIIENLFFYNPAVWAISKMIRNEREKCCDDRVLDSCKDPLNYAKALYQLAGQNQQLTHLAPGAGGSDQFQLLSRIKRILNQGTMKNTIREKLFSLLILAGGVLIMLTVTGFSSGFSIVKENGAWQKLRISQSTDPQAMAEPATEPIITPLIVPVPEPIVIPVADTVPEVEDKAEEARIEALEEIDWEEIKKEMEEARLEVMGEIDWEEIKKEMEEARLEVMEEIDWEEIRIEMEDFKIDLDSLKMDMDFDFDLDVDIDWEELELEMARAKVHLDSLFRDMDLDLDLDFEQEL